MFKVSLTLNNSSFTDFNYISACLGLNLSNSILIKNLLVLSIFKNENKYKVNLTNPHE